MTLYATFSSNSPRAVALDVVWELTHFPIFRRADEELNRSRETHPDIQNLAKLDIDPPVPSRISKASPPTQMYIVARVGVEGHDIDARPGFICG